MVSAVLVPLLLLFSSCTTLIADAGVDELNYIVVATSSLKAKAVCEGPGVNTSKAGFENWVPVTRPHGPCSAAPGKSEPSVGDMLRWDQRRAAYIQRMVSMPATNASSRSVPPASPTVQSSMVMSGTDPTATLQAGSKPKQMSSQLSIDPAATGGGGGGGGQTMVLDTGSVFPWLQCAPCPVPPCHPQKETLYDPAKSSTSATFSCSSPECAQLGPWRNGCVNNQCQYRVQYPDGSTTMGTYVSDVITLTPKRVLSKFQFGCSHFAQGASINAQTAGTMGLGGGPQSLVSQGNNYGNGFSYCIPPTASKTGFFLLGIPRRATYRFAVTPMFKGNFSPTLYAVRLQAIKVAGQQLAVPPMVFAAGSIMDSRAPITRLPPMAYQALRSAFMSRMTMYRMTPPKEHLDTCYDFTGVSTISLPKITLVFDRNAAVELHPSGILFEGCLAFTSTIDNNTPGIIGNVQQRTIEVFYNVGGGAMAFRSGAC